MTKDESLKQANDIAVGVDVTKEGTHVVAMRLKPNGVNEVIYSQFHPMAQSQERYTYGTPLLDAMVGCPPCNNHCNQGRTCPNRQTRKTTREEKITKPGVYERRLNEEFDAAYDEYKANFFDIGLYGGKHIGKEIQHQIDPPNATRNEVLEEVAKQFDKMPFGDTASSFATFVRNMKT